MARHLSTEGAPVPRAEERDQQLLQAAQACLRSRQDGYAPSQEEKEPVEQFFAVHIPLLRCFVAGRHLVGADADDCLQEACTRILKGLSGFVSDGRPGALRCWMYEIVRTQAAKLHRDRKQHRAETLGPEVEAILACRDAGPTV
jgi:DNA-directed RNA polymerase specialized sigma24 family protein